MSWGLVDAAIARERVAASVAHMLAFRGRVRVVNDIGVGSDVAARQLKTWSTRSWPVVSRRRRVGHLGPGPDGQPDPEPAVETYGARPGEQCRHRAGPMIANTSEEGVRRCHQVHLSAITSPNEQWHAASHWRDYSRRAKPRKTLTRGSPALARGLLQRGAGNYSAAKAGIAALTLVAPPKVRRTARSRSLGGAHPHDRKLCSRR